jgi:hypothetical protein
VRIGVGLPTEERDSMLKFLSENLDVFAWCTADMVGVDPWIICHHMSIKEGKKPVK